MIEAFDFVLSAEPIARKLLGQPNARLSKPQELRFGTNGSLKVDLSKGTFYDFENDVGGGIIDLVQVKLGLDRDGALRWIDEANGRAGGHTCHRIVATYRYEDEEGKLLFEVVRYDPKRFVQRRPVGNGGWSYNLDGVRRVPYLLPELIEATALDNVVFIVEGEKDCHSVQKFKIPATTCPGGANKWRPEYNEFFRDADVIVVPDADEPGRKHAKNVAAQLSPVAKRLRLVEMPAAKDVSDWIAGGGTAEKLWQLVEATPVWIPDNHETASKSRLVTINASKVKPRNIDFVWPGRLALGKHTCIAGEGGLGKTQLLIDVTARCTNGDPWPCSDDHAPIGDVVILSAEDGVADVLVPHLLAAGANMERVHIVKAVFKENGKGERRFNLQHDLQELEKKITEIGHVLLVWIDPVSSYLGNVDSHNNTALRSVLDPISEMAERTNVAFASVTHFTKGAADKGIKAMHRVMGGAAFTTAPRAAFAVIEDPDDKDRRLVLHLKNNLAAKPPGLAFRLGARMVGHDERDGKEIWATHVLWEDKPVDTTADEAIAASAPGAAEKGSAREEAADFLHGLLRDGPVAASEVLEAAKANGIAARTLKRAKADLRVMAQHRPDLDGGWEWVLPEGGQKGSKGATSESGPLREDLAPFVHADKMDTTEPAVGGRPTPQQEAVERAIKRERINDLMAGLEDP